MLLNCHGYIVEMRDRNFNRMIFEYADPFNPSTSYYVLKRITDTIGRVYNLDYVTGEDKIPRVHLLRDKWGREVEYHYDKQHQLTRVSLVK